MVHIEKDNILYRLYLLTFFMRYIMKYLMLVVYFFATASFANHCSSGASHGGPDRQADQGHMESNESAKKDSDSTDESSEAMNQAENDA